MTKPSIQNSIKQVKRTLQIQSVLVTLFAMLTVFFFDASAARSVFLGGLVAWVSQAVFAWHAFRYAGARANAMVLRSMFHGMFVKWVISITGLAMIFKLYKPENPEFVIVGFILIIFTNWAYVVLVKR